MSNQMTIFCNCVVLVVVVVIVVFVVVVLGTQSFLHTLANLIEAK